MASNPYMNLWNFSNIEVGNTQQTARAIFVGDEAVSAINYSSDQDWYRVFLTEGADYQIRLEGMGGVHGLASPELILYDSHGNTEAIGDNYDYSSLFYMPSSSGYYYISAGARAGDIGEYKLSVFSDENDPFSPRLETDTDLIHDEFAYSLLPGQRVAASINGVDDEDSYSVVLEAGKTYVASIVGIGPEAIERPTLTYSYNSDSDIQGVFYESKIYTHQLGIGSQEGDSIHVIAAQSPYFEGHGGNYLISLVEADVLETSTDIIGNNLANAYDISLNAAIIGQMNGANDVDYYKLVLPAGSNFILNLYSHDTDGLNDPYIRVFSESGQFITGQISQYGGFSVSLSSNEENALIIGVQSASQSGVGSYVLSTVQVYDIVEGGIESTARIDLDTHKSGALESPDDQDWYRITLNSSTNYQINIDEITPRGIEKPSIAVYTADGIKVVEYSHDEYGATYSSISEWALSCLCL